jgi:hypothetical protein
MMHMPRPLHQQCGPKGSRNTNDRLNSAEVRGARCREVTNEKVACYRMCLHRIDRNDCACPDALRRLAKRGLISYRSRYDETGR